MKKQLLIWILLAGSIHSFSQITDLQWLIADGKGKQGISGDYNNYSEPNVVGSLFQLMGVTMPNSANHPDAYNDLFAIYSDGNHFNSRYSSPSDAFFRTTGSFSTTTDHYFKSTHPEPIVYMYLTNGYEQDDLPPRLMVNGGSTSPTLYSFASTTTPALTASHDAVLTKDITLVINMDSVRNHFPGTTYKLYFDGVEPVSSPSVPILGLDIYDPSKVFNGTSSSVYPDGTLTVTGEAAEFGSGPEKYRYLNLRANDNALLYPPDQITGNPQYNALFRIVSSGAKDIELREPIRFSHDPNFLRVDSICRDDKGGHYIYYHLEFENENFTATTSLYATFKLPDEFDPDCIYPTKWMTAGVECSGDLIVSGDSCTFLFSKSSCAGIIQSETNPVLATGYVKLRAKVDPGYNVQVVTNPIRLIDPIVYMDGVPTEIKDFRDLINAKANPHRPLLDHDCKFCGTGPVTSWLLAISALLLGGGIMWWRGRRT